MAVDVVVGMHWGDEGKGKIVDALAPGYDVIARYQGGPNAGHTVYIGDEKFVFHVIPSGILWPEKINIIGNGAVIDLGLLVKEIEELSRLGVSTGNLYISDSAHLIMPYHLEFEKNSAVAKGIETTSKGIGPAYTDKAKRTGIRLYNLRDPSLFKDKIMQNAKELGIEVDADQMADEYLSLFERVERHVTDTRYLINELDQAGKNILCEGAQGTLLDLDHGTDKYVTSSNSTAGGAATGLGLPPKFRKVIGVMKAYITRVGNGQFPTELGDNDRLKGEARLSTKPTEFAELEQCVSNGCADDHEIGRYIRATGDEYGATTGRPRRTGWQDLLASTYARMVNGIDFVAMTKLDIFDKLPYVKVATYYADRKGNLVSRFNPNHLGCLTAGYVTLEGWQAETGNVRNYEDLPDNAKRYIEFLEKQLNRLIRIISVGPKRNQTIFR